MSTQTLPRSPIWHLVILAYAAFIGLGLYDGLLGVMWPNMRASFGLPVDALGILLIAGTSGHILASFANGRLINRYGIALLVVVGPLFLTIGDIVQATSPVWWLVVLIGFVSGAGAGFVDSGLNTYAAAHFRARLLNWLHACFGIGTTAGALLMTAVLGANLSWRVGLLIVGVINGFIFLAFLFTRNQWQMSSLADATAAPAKPQAANRETLRLPLVWVGIAIFFLYTGLEVGVGGWAVTVLTESRGVPETTAGFWTTLYWGSLTVGRVVFGFVETKLNRLVRWAMIGSLAGTVLFGLNLSAATNLVSMMMIGFFLAPIFPMLIALTPGRVGESHAANAIGYEVGAAGIGIAILPSLAGVMGDSYGLETISWFIVAVAILLFALHEVQMRMLSQSDRAK